MANNQPNVSQGPSVGFVDGYVPYVSVEEFKPHTCTEARDFVAASIKGIQARRQKEALEAQFNLELDSTGGE